MLNARDGSHHENGCKVKVPNSLLEKLTAEVRELVVDACHYINTGVYTHVAFTGVEF